jgi:hypothetical protein
MMPHLKRMINKRRRYSHKKLGLAKIGLMDIKLKIKYDITKHQDEKEKYFKQILAIKSKKGKRSIASLISHKHDPKVLELQKKHDAIDAKIKEMKDRSTQAFFRAKKIVEGLKKNKSFVNSNTDRKKTCLNKVKGYKKAFIP